jgi:ribose-phosphate pyrophosphokinase
MGAGDIYVCATHGLFTSEAIQRLQNAPIEECVITDSVPCSVANQNGSKIKMVSVAREMAEAIHHVYCNEPTTEIFGGDLHTGILASIGFPLCLVICVLLIARTEKRAAK